MISRLMLNCARSSCLYNDVSIHPVFFFSFEGELIMDIAYGYEVQGRDDRKLDVAIRMTEFGNGTFLPGALLVNELPFRMSSSHFCAAY